MASSKSVGDADSKSGSDLVALMPAASLSCDEGGLGFELEICNTGLDDLNEVVMKQQLPLGLVLVEGSITAVDAAGEPIDAGQCNAGDDGDDEDDDADLDHDDDGDHDDEGADVDHDDDGDSDDDDADLDQGEDGDHHGDAADDSDGDDGDDDAADGDGDDDDDEHGESNSVEICLDAPIAPGECVLVSFVATIGEAWSEVEVHAKSGDGESDDDDVEVETGSDISEVLGDLLTAACEPCQGTPATGDLAAFCGLAPNECDPLAIFGCVDAVDTAVNDLFDAKCTSCCSTDLTCSCIFGE